MSGLILLIIGLVFFYGGYLFYKQYLAKIFCVNNTCVTPAHTHNDGIDFVPTPGPVVFGHHFASIAGAGPIVGPVLGAAFGWGPVALWVIIGCICIGAVHDFAALMVSLKHHGFSIGHVIEKYLSYPGRQIFLIFCFFALILVVAVFALFVAKTFTANPAVATSSLWFIILALVFGALTRKNILTLKTASVIFVPLVFAGLFIGLALPFNLQTMFGLSNATAQSIWTVILMIYVFAASTAPVWILLQPRDYLNSFLLYSLVFLGLGAVVVAQPTLTIPVFSGWTIADPTVEPANASTWPLFPILFVTIACGACSGFHSLVASGTTSKQIAKEDHAFPIGYGAMLVEGVLALIALIAVGSLGQTQFLSQLRTAGPVSTFAFGLASLSVKLGVPIEGGKVFVSLCISAFMLTTLDTATRLTRLTLYEMAMPKSGDVRHPNLLTRALSNRYWASAFVCVLSGYLAISGDAGSIWPIFGAANQLLAALTLLAVSIILISTKKNCLSTVIPFLIMMAISVSALVNLLIQNFYAQKFLLAGISFLLLTISAVLIVYAVQKIFGIKKTN